MKIQEQIKYIFKDTIFVINICKHEDKAVYPWFISKMPNTIIDPVKAASYLTSIPIVEYYQYCISKYNEDRLDLVNTHLSSKRYAVDTLLHLLETLNFSSEDILYIE